MKKIILIPFLLFMMLKAKSQWQQTGNPPAGPLGVFQPNNNFLGSNAGNPSCIKLGVTASQDIFIDNNPAQLLPGNGFGYVQGGHWVGLGRIFQPSLGVGSGVLTPRAHLHIHGGNQTPFFGFASGIRNWFNTGTLYTENSDGMYVGMRTLGNNQSYAVINWSDDGFGAGGTDFLSFNFTGGPGPLATTNDGMELARFNPTHIPGGAPGTFGVGNFQILLPNLQFTEPVRRVEILDADPSTGANANAPQLRLTYTYNANPVLGIFSEKQVMASGHTYFNTRANGVPKFFGFHTNGPNNTVEINSVIASPYFGTAFGCSGLRFTNLVSTHNPVPHGMNGVDATKVLTVDGAGDVVLTNPIAAPPTNNGITTLPAGLGGPAIQLGVNCTQIFSQPALLTQATLQTGRFVFLSGQPLIFGDGPANAGRIGIGNIPGLFTCGVANTLEVGADAASPYGSVNSSGLRFSRLTSASPVLANGTNGVNNTKVLTVDGSGDVVLVTPSGGIAGCNPLSSHTGFLLNNFNFYFDGQGNPDNSVGIGYACSSPLLAKLDVLENVGVTTKNPSIAIRGVNRDLTGSAALGFQVVGIFGLCAGIQTNFGVEAKGGYFVANNATSNIGVKGEVIPNVAGAPQNALSSIAGYFHAHSNTGSNTGIFATANGGGTSTNLAAQFNGNGQFTGTWTQGSDSTFKTNVSDISSPLSIISSLKPKSFYFDTNNTNGLIFPSKKQYGFLAQHINQILPELVYPSTYPGDSAHAPTSLLALNYNAFIGLLTAGMQQQQLSIDSLRNQPAAGICGGIATNTITKWTGTEICNSQITDDGTNAGIGGTSSNTLFRVFNTGVSSRNNAAAFHTILPGNTNNNFGAIIQSEGSTNENIGLSVAAVNNTSTAVSNWGIQSYAAGASGQNYAGTFVADQPGTVSGSTSYALYAQTTGGADNNYGIFAKATGASVNNWAGYFDGNVNVNGSYFQNGSLFTSDQTLKTNIDSITNATSIIGQLKPRSFYFDTTNGYGMSFSSKKQYGLVAQDVQTVLPELVSTVNKPADYDTAGNMTHQAKSYQSLNYNAFIALLIKSNQEQQRQLDSIKSVLSGNNTKTTSGGKNVSVIDIELSDADVIVLNQNVPNPFAEQTTITYNIPQNVTFAQILFYDINGRQIKAVDINKKGKGQLNVFANDLSNGVYSYTLIVDGKIFETKKMVKQQ